MLLSSILVMSLFAATTQQTAAVDEPLDLMEQYIVSQRSLGDNHPRTQNLRERIQDATDNNFEFSLPLVQERFETLVKERRSLMRTNSLTHPAVMENATRLSLISRLLAGQSASLLKEFSESR
jgi:FKBP-type peptidyl-prolyl cis-trans isomerase (trigger factor)